MLLIEWFKGQYHYVRCVFGYHEWFCREEDLVGCIDCFSGCRHCNKGAWLVVDSKRTEAC